MKTLVFMRHATSGGNHPHLPDIERPLTVRGEQEAPMMGREISRRAIRPDLIMSSPAVRALASARLVAGEMGFADHMIRVEPALYDASIDHYLEVITALPDNAQSVLLVGHNPAITECVNSLVPASVADMPAGGVAALALGIETWSQLKRGCGRLLFTERPATGGSRE